MAQRPAQRSGPSGDGRHVIRTQCLASDTWRETDTRQSEREEGDWSARQDMLGGAIVLALLSAGATKKSQKPSTECQVTGEDRTAAAQPPPPSPIARASCSCVIACACLAVTLSDGSTEPRDCFVLDGNDASLKPGTKGRFESCTA